GALITVFAKSNGLTNGGPSFNSLQSNREIVCALENIVPTYKPSSRAEESSAFQPPLDSASSAAADRSRAGRSSAYEFRAPRCGSGGSGAKLRCLAAAAQARSEPR